MSFKLSPVSNCSDEFMSLAIGINRKKYCFAAGGGFRYSFINHEKLSDCTSLIVAKMIRHGGVLDTKVGVA